MNINTNKKTLKKTILISLFVLLGTDSYAQETLKFLGPPSENGNVIERYNNNWQRGKLGSGKERELPKNIASLFAETLNGTPREHSFEANPVDDIVYDSLYVSNWFIFSDPSSYDSYETIRRDLDNLVNMSPNAKWESPWRGVGSGFFQRSIIINEYNSTGITLIYGHPDLYLAFQLTIIWYEMHER